jgi:hypothetical protein
MANLSRSAKSGSDWTQGDLDSYNIHVKVKDTATFFGILDLPQPHVDPEILNVESADNMTVDKNAELITLLDIAMIPTGPEDSAVGDFTVELFKVLGYVWRKRLRVLAKTFLCSSVVSGDMRKQTFASSIIRKMIFCFWCKRISRLGGRRIFRMQRLS